MQIGFSLSPTNSLLMRQLLGGVAPDVTAPTLTSPTGTQTGSTTGTSTVSTNEANGTLYSFLSTSSTPPTAANLKAGTGAVTSASQTVTGTGVQSVNWTGLTASTLYYTHWLHRDAAGNDSAIVSGAGFTTAAASGQVSSLNFTSASYSAPSGASTLSALTSTARSTSAYSPSASGAYTQFAANVPRVTDRGLHIERAARSYMNSAFAGAVNSGLASNATLAANSGTLPKGMTVFVPGCFWQVIDTGTDATTGLPRLRLRVAGSPTTGTAIITLGPTAPGNGLVFVASCFVGFPTLTSPPARFYPTINATGTSPIMVPNDDTYTAGSSTGTGSAQYIGPDLPLVATATRFEFNPALLHTNATGVSLRIEGPFTAGTPLDFIMDIVCPQIETVPDRFHRATSPIIAASVATTVNGATTASTSVTVTSSAGMSVGQLIVATGIPVGTTITNIAGNILTISAAATISNAAAITAYGGFRDQDVITASGALLASLQSATATIAAKIGQRRYHTASAPLIAQNIPGAGARRLPILGLNGSAKLLSREADGSIATATGAGAQTFRAFLPNWTLKAHTATLTWNAGNVGLSSTACANYTSASGAPSAVTSVQIGSDGGTATLDGFIESLIVSDAYTSDLSAVGALGNADVVIYGAKPGGLLAAWRARLEGRSVVVMGDWREYVVGGMQASGLQMTDVGSIGFGATASSATTSSTTIPVATLTAATTTTTAATTAGNTLTLTSVTVFTLNRRVYGGGIPVGGARITAVNTGTKTLTLDINVTVASGASVFTPSATVTPGKPVVINGVDTGLTVVDVPTTTSITVSSPVSVPNGASVFIVGPIGGLPRKFYTLANAKAGASDVPAGVGAGWTVNEGRIFRATYEDILAQNGIPVYFTGGVTSVTKASAKITAMGFQGRVSGAQVCSPKSIVPKVVGGCDYEGDILPLAAISYNVGAEANATYNEINNGLRAQGTVTYNGTNVLADPYVTVATPGSGLLPGLDTRPSPYTAGIADTTRLQTYNFRLSVAYTNGASPGRSTPYFPLGVSTDTTAFMVAGQNEGQLREIAAFQAIAAAGSLTLSSSDFVGQKPISTVAYDFNQGNSQPSFGLDLYNVNKGYLTTPDAAGYAAREVIYQNHVKATQRFLWTHQYSADSRVPAALQTSFRLIGMDKWQHFDNISTDIPYFNSNIYVREGRRMLNADFPTSGANTYPQFNERDVVMLDGTTPRDPRSISAMSYVIDAHPSGLYPNAAGNGFSQDSGVAVALGAAAAGGIVFGADLIGPVPLACVVPAVAECTNYFTSFHGAMSHVSFAAFRMEPSSQAVGEAMGLLAAMAVEGNTALQSVTYGDDVTAGTFRYRLMSRSVSGADIPPIAPLLN